MRRLGIVILVGISLLTLNCAKHKEENLPLYVEINDFVWKGMNTYYLWQDSIPNLADNRFSSQNELNSFLEDYNEPEDLFYDLRYKPDEVDKWSWIVDDYVALEEYFSGVRKTSGAKLKLYLLAEGSDEIYGVVRYVLPDTDAASKSIERGAVFRSVNGVNLNRSNYKDLLYNSASFTLNLGLIDLSSGSVEIIATGEDVELENGEYTENPVLKKSIIEIDGNNVGYLMYNSFTANYNNQLNDAFQYFNAAGVTDLVLDLRYNGGGSVQTAIYLSGMITGQFEGQVFTKEQWNSKMQEWLLDNHPEWLVNKFTNTMSDGTALNTLNLNRVIVITTKDSASASELVINALKPYIDVVTVGTTTHGKYVASVTLYDSDNFGREGANPDHLFAIQPIVLKELNSVGEYAQNGFEPAVFFPENIANMGELGTASDPLTFAALSYISGTMIRSSVSSNRYKPINTTINTLENEMYISRDMNLKERESFFSK